MKADSGTRVGQVDDGETVTGRTGARSGRHAGGPAVPWGRYGRAGYTGLTTNSLVPSNVLG